MAINKYQDHLLILFEDDAYRDIANGFLNYPHIIPGKVIKEKPVGGWISLLNGFSHNYVADIRKYQNRYVLLLLDLDNNPARAQNIDKAIPVDIKDRVFFLSSFSEAENIKNDFGGGKFETIGKNLAMSCYDGHYTIQNTVNPWNCSQLKHNQNQLIRLATAVRPFLFSS